MYYHMLANKNKSQDYNFVIKSNNYEAQRAWFWFPLFSFFESSIDGKIPNEFELPIHMYDVNEMFKHSRYICTFLKSKYVLPTT